MKKIDLEHLTIYSGVAHTKSETEDFREDIANLLYQKAYGIAAKDLAFRIYRSHGPVEISDADLTVLMSAVERFACGAIIDAVSEQVKSLNENKEKK